MTSTFIIYLLSVIIAFLIALKADKSTNVRKKIILTGLSVFIFTAGIFIRISDLKGPYMLKNMQEFWAEYQLPQIDSMMYVSYFDKTAIEYSSSCRGSIYHGVKRMEYDIFGLTEVTDFFYNRKNKQTLKVKFKSKRFYRKQSTSYTINDWQNNIGVIEITTTAFNDSIRAWGLADKIYTRITLATNR